jgi:hypothetical protein
VAGPLQGHTHITPARRPVRDELPWKKWNLSGSRRCPCFACPWYCVCKSGNRKLETLSPSHATRAGPVTNGARRGERGCGRTGTVWTTGGGRALSTNMTGLCSLDGAASHDSSCSARKLASRQRETTGFLLHRRGFLIDNLAVDMSSERTANIGAPSPIARLRERSSPGSFLVSLAVETAGTAVLPGLTYNNPPRSPQCGDARAR